MANLTNSTNVVRPEIFDKPWQNFITVLFIIISVTGITANSYVISKIARVKELHTPLNLLLMNLSIADLLAGISIYPFLFLDVSRTNIRGTTANILCTFSTALILFFVAAGESVLTLCAISFSRFIIIKFPLKPHFKLTIRGSIYFAVVSWIASVSLLIPNGLTFRYEEDTGYCYRYYPTWIKWNLYSGVTIIFGTVLPLATMTLTYIVTWRTLWREGPNSSIANNIQSRKKIMVMLGVLIAAYVSCWSPFYAYWTMVPVLKYYKNTPEDRIKIFRFYTIAVLFGLCNSLLDPLIYTMSGTQFRRAIRKHTQVRSVHFDPKIRLEPSTHAKTIAVPNVSQRQSKTSSRQTII